MKKSSNTKQSLIEIARGAYPTLRKFAVFALVGGLALSPLITLPQYKVGLLFPLGITLLFLLFDILGDLQKRLSAIEERVAHSRPPSFPDYRAAEYTIYQAIEDSLVESPIVDLKFLTVAGLYSWPFLEDAIRRLDERFPQKKTFVVTFCLVRPPHFDSWSLIDWKRRAQATLANIEAFKRRYALPLESGQIVLGVYLYDNLPHWHGVLINDDVLYLGRTEWEYPEGLAPNILVGQIEYREFRKGDRFDGNARIKRFNNWVERYKRRDCELGAYEGA